MRTWPTWRAARDPGTGRATLPVEVNGLQAHAILHHGKRVEDALATDVHTLANLHSRWHRRHENEANRMPEGPEKNQAILTAILKGAEFADFPKAER